MGPGIARSSIDQTLVAPFFARRIGKHNPHPAASPQRGRNTLAPVARLGTTERSRVPARFSGQKNHCAQISFVLYQAMAEHPCRGEFASRRTGPPARKVQGASSGPSSCAGESPSRQIHFIFKAGFTKGLHLSDLRIRSSCKTFGSRVSESMLRLVSPPPRVGLPCRNMARRS